MRLLILWNISLTIALSILLFNYNHRLAAPMHVKAISTSFEGGQLTHGNPRPGNGFVSSRVSSSGAIHLTQFLQTGAGPHESEAFGITQQTGQNGSSLSVSYHDMNGEKSAEGILSATSPLSDSVRSGAHLQLSSEGGGKWIELGFNKAGRPFLKVSGEGKEKIWWLLD